MKATAAIAYFGAAKYLASRFSPVVAPGHHIKRDGPITPGGRGITSLLHAQDFPSHFRREHGGNEMTRAVHASKLHSARPATVFVIKNYLCSSRCSNASARPVLSRSIK
jgi:hypothetical protein